MLLTKKINININTNKDRTYYKLGYYNKNNIKEDNINIDIDIKDLIKSSKLYVDVKCDICGKEKKIQYYKYLQNIKKYKLYTCSQKCAYFKIKQTKKEKYGDENFNNRKKSKETCLKKYNVENPQQLEIVQNKTKLTKFDKYNDEFYTNKEKAKHTKKYKYNDENFNNRKKSKNTKLKRYNDENFNNREKAKQTWLEKYNVENPQQLKEIREKTQETLLKKYNVKYTFYSKEIQDKIKTTNIERYDNEIPQKNNKIKNKIKKGVYKYYNKFITDKYDDFDISDIDNNRILTIKCKNKNHYYRTNKNTFKLRLRNNSEPCTICNPPYSYSGEENELYNFIKENYQEKIIRNTKKLIKPYELDIYLPNLNLAFEFNGLYWHSEIYKDNNYHKMKSDMCVESGIQLIQIYEDDWKNRNDIIKSIILNKIGNIKNKIYARKCEIKEIKDNNIVKNFLNKNHLQGYSVSSVKIGLYYNGELVSLMTFSKNRIFMKNKNNNGEYEMIRFCNKLNYVVVGGASRLFKYFINNYDIKNVISYANRDISKGNLYIKLGFSEIKKTDPNYYYIIKNKRVHRFNFRKNKLVEQGYNKELSEHDIMIGRGIYRIYNSGSLKFEYLPN